MTATKRGSSSQKLPGGLVALSSAAILTVYAAGYYRTRPAADRFVVEAARRSADSPAVHPADAPAVTFGAPAPASPAPLSQPRQPDGLRPQPPAVARREPAASAPAALPDAAPVHTETAAAAPVENPVAVEARTPAIAAPAPEADITPAPVQPQPVTPASQFRDGTYQGWGSCRHGDIEATVVVEEGRIVSASISQCRTRYSCSWIAGLPPQVIGRQSAQVDYVSGATESTEAFSDAITAALSKAK